ncbi:MAG: hypothetical protein ACR2RV_09130 [Verrucomicrobiales bacterium]
MKSKILSPLPRILVLALLTVLLCHCAMSPPPNRTTYEDYRATSSNTQPMRPGLGTSWGESRQSRVDNTEFERGSRSPYTKMAIRYNDATGLPSGRWSARQPFSAGGIASIGIKSGGRYLKCYGTSADPVVVGKHGQRYSIHVKNHTGERIEVVLSVDGLDVLDGRSASQRKRGYVIAPHGRLEVEGFRRSYESVAAFRFGSVSSSYAARSTGSARNVGVIGAAIFREEGGSDWHTRQQANPFPGERGSGQFSRPPGA